MFGIALQILCLADISNENFKKYLNFIELSPSKCQEVTEKCLMEVVFHHVSHIAYQNQTIFNHEELNLDTDFLCSKLIDNHEGGIVMRPLNYCMKCF